VRRQLTHAEELLQSLGIEAPSDIDIEAIAWHCGVKVKEQPLDGCDAQIIGNNDKAIVTININQCPERKRFSIGHELGHWKYHRGRSFVCRSGDISNQGKKRSITDPELVADNYAADLLMPEYLFQPKAQQYKNVNFDAIRELAECFSTSLIATAFRYVKHSFYPSMLVCHAPKETRWRWFKVGAEVPEKLFLEHRLNTSSIAHKVMYSGLEQPYPESVQADIWFNNEGADRYYVYEQSIPIGNGCILTLLSWRNTHMLERFAA